MRDVLVQYLENLPSLDGRFEDLKCVNYKPGRQKRGHFSLIFKARDLKTRDAVAIKFHDPAQHEAYRIQAFEREPEIVELVSGKRRCPQLVVPLTTHNWQVSGPNTSLPIKYFSIKWIADSIDRYFLDQQSYDPIPKLSLFHDIVSAVDVLHRNRVFHRDLKPDNLRMSSDAMPCVIPIDFGTAARFESQQILMDYGSPVGALLYASPEAYCGLAGNRSIAPYADLYSLGCLLFELFNHDYFGYRYSQSQSYKVAIIAIAQDLASRRPAERPEAWTRWTSRLKGSIPVPDIDGPGSTVPVEISDSLNGLMKRLVCFDYYDRRLDLDWLRRRVRSTIAVLENEALRARLRRQKRLARARKLERQELRLTGKKDRLEIKDRP